MQDIVGQTLGHYRIVDKIGASQLLLHPGKEPARDNPRVQALLETDDTEPN